MAALVLSVALSASASAAAPNYHGCLTSSSMKFGYCNISLSSEERARSLLKLLTLEEKVGLIAPDPGIGDTCFANIRGIPRFELPPYGWLVECNTGVASQCLGPDQCATTFPGPTGLGASFDRSLWTAKGEVMSTEMRAFSNARWYRGIGASYPGHPAAGASYIGVSAFGPNLNIIRCEPPPPLPCSGYRCCCRCCRRRRLPAPARPPACARPPAALAHRLPCGVCGREVQNAKRGQTRARERRR
eukprot:SAG22_NODE_6301_length_873_cov_0.935401_2_plen_245_part_00